MNQNSIKTNLERETNVSFDPPEMDFQKTPTSKSFPITRPL